MERHRTSGRRGLGFALASTTMLLWGVLPVALKVVLSVMDAATITWFRFVGASLILGGVLAGRRRLPGLRSLERSGVLLLVAATVFLGGNYLAYLLSLDRTTPADAQVLIQIGPLLLALGGLVVFRETFGRLQWLGFSILLVGLGVFFRGQLAGLAADVAGRDRYVWGNLLMVVAAGAWALYGLAQKQLLRAMPSEHVMLCIYVGCAALFTPLAAPSEILRLGPGALAVLAFCTLNTVVAYGAFAEALEHWEASRVGAVLALTPLATLAMVDLASGLWPSLDVGHRPLSWASLLGAGLVVAGSLVVSLAAPRVAGARSADVG